LERPSNLQSFSRWFCRSHPLFGPLFSTLYQPSIARLSNGERRALGRDGKNLVTSSGVRHFNDESNPHYRDLAAFEFTESCTAHPDLKERFFDLRKVPPAARNTDIIFAVVAGFPSGDQKYELEEKNHIGKLKRIVVCVSLTSRTFPTAARATSFASRRPSPSFRKCLTTVSHSRKKPASRRRYHCPESGCVCFARLPRKTLACVRAGEA
jgi:hypothetical protein